jgi:hydrogenase maturation protease
VKTLILGIGNPILGDDGVGVRVAEELARKATDPDYEVKAADTDGLGLLDIVLGYNRLILIDALMGENVEPGKIYRFRADNLGGSDMVSLTHGVNVRTSFKLGKMLFPKEMPGEIIIFGVGIEQASRFSEEMTPLIKNAVKSVCDLVLQELKSPVNINP